MAGEKLRLVPAGGLDLVALVLDLTIPLLKFLEQAHVFERNHCLIGESFEQLDLRRSEGAHFGERALDFPIELINTSLQSTS